MFTSFTYRSTHFVLEEYTQIVFYSTAYQMIPVIKYTVYTRTLPFIKSLYNITRVQIIPCRRNLPYLTHTSSTQNTILTFLYSV